MAIIRWQPWHEMESLRRQMDQLFDDLTPITRDAASVVTGRAWSPAVELKGTDTEVILRAELPGIKPEDLDVQVTPDTVAIAGEYKTESQSEDHNVFRSEFRYGSFRRVIPLPSAIQNDQVKAEFKDGILTLTMPKVEAEQPKVVKVKLAEAAG